VSVQLRQSSARLREQVAAFYDPKTKTVNLLDWTPVEPAQNIWPLPAGGGSLQLLKSTYGCRTQNQDG
jgi:hypothetical protein